MIVRAITVHVKEDALEEFIALTRANHAASLKEPGVLRFDVLQSETDPRRFLLYEAYADREATLAHKETAHYLAWKRGVEAMMAGPRESGAFTVLAPLDPAAW
jgi:autoinducer 2-degrading protein